MNLRTSVSRVDRPRRPINLTSATLVVSAAMAIGLLSAQSAAGEVTIERVDDTLQIKVNGRHFTTYNFGEDLPKPYFWPLRSNDAIITRPLENPEDHPHHKGVWIAVDEVNGIKFWVEQGKIVNREVEILNASGETASFQATNEWRGPDGKPVLVETTTVTCNDEGLMDFNIALTPAGEEATFEDTKEGFLAIRVPNGMRESDDGHVFNADGLQTAGRCWGVPSRWVNYDGPVDGETHGVAMFDHPSNPHPARYHVRNYGLFGISPFGDKAYSNGEEEASHVHLANGETYQLRYAIYVHPGEGDAEKIDSVYKNWAGKE